MQRIAFQLRLKADKIAEYELSHRNVWPELLTEMEGFGVREYSIFRRGHELFLYMHVPNFDRLMEQLAASEVNLRWQKAMAPLFEPASGLLPGETFAMMQEVFYMRGMP
jgi:L-rhamnose mutarotase